MAAFVTNVELSLVTEQSNLRRKDVRLRTVLATTS
jgi:hypothetical protein